MWPCIIILNDTIILSNDTRSTVTGWSFDNDERHVTASAKQLIVEQTTNKTSVGLKARVENHRNDGRTDTTDRITFCACVVGNRLIRFVILWPLKPVVKIDSPGLSWVDVSRQSLFMTSAGKKDYNLATTSCNISTAPTALTESGTMKTSVGQQVNNLSAIVYTRQRLKVQTGDL